MSCVVWGAFAESKRARRLAAPFTHPAPFRIKSEKCALVRHRPLALSLEHEDAITQTNERVHRRLHTRRLCSSACAQQGPVR